LQSSLLNDEPSRKPPSVKWAFFSNPTTFIAILSSDTGGDITLQMELRDGAWKVTSVSLPPELINAGNGHSSQSPEKGAPGGHLPLSHK
jgi:hypothetical protein